VVVGGEAKRWLGPPAAEAAGADDDGPVPDVVHRRADPLLEPVEVAHRLWTRSSSTP